MVTQNKRRSGEQGNVLFLVLIAVVLFAALSYAVTGSTRGQNNQNDGTDKIGSAQITQFPAAVATAIMRMSIDGVNISDLEFNTAADFGALSSNDFGVFHPEGGGVEYQAASPSVMAGNTQGQWYFNAEFEVEYIGVSMAPSFNGNEIIAFLPGVKRGVCVSINKEIGLDGVIPDSSADLSAEYQVYMDESYTLPTDEVVLGTVGSNGTDLLQSMPFGCFQNNGGDYVYYHVLSIQ